ncbi:heterokaryon incompatibility protein-domain-containing protein [Fusarium solani]|uniref:Heterokaryon incompatibility protein-domain-containing protein n=1 Tax=Fusarium solani TaxID=169388 RepID=A0A9P9G3K5_FUSSL|nr:heterokaryon incompatibility protein-domain-containing protein [Fusarium solani]KAH7232444.1 heterokaryon incompatibility protein-domain-containing protein [Fusarium solani]
MSNLVGYLIYRHVPYEVKHEVLIHTVLYVALSWGMDKNETVDYELLTLGPKGGVPPPEPFLWTFGYNRVLVFALLALLCMAPRLYVGPRAIMAHGGDNIYGTRGWAYGLAWALIHHYPKMLFPLWGQWICYLFSYFSMAPTPTSIAGLECLFISILGYLLALPPALIFATYRFSDTIIHPVRRYWAGDRQDSGILENERASVLWFLRLYVLLLVLERHFPNFCTGFAFWSFWSCIAGGPITYLISVLRWSSQFAPESYNSQSWEPRPFSPQSWELRPFYYTPLADETHIRLLKVFPSLCGDAPVVCDLVQVRLNGSRPLYSAISYRWQAQTEVGRTRVNPASTKSKAITVNGFRFAVYPNVLAILKDMRSSILPRYLWIDSICIDQDNLREKENQVAIMRQIYEGSVYVIIHLAGSDHYISFLEEMFSSLRSSLTGTPYRDVGRVGNLIANLRDARVLQDFSVRDSPGELLSIGTSDDWDILESLLEDSWFARAWIVQEVTVARRVRLRRSGHEIHWGDFVRACAVLSRSGVRGYIHYRHITDGKPFDMVGEAKLAGVENTLILDNLRQWYASGRLLPLLDTMILCLRFKSTWEVDKIYALLGIIDAEDRERLGLEPDYARDKTALFKALTCRLLETASPEDQFRLLRFAGIGQRRNMDGLPSWVPDWTAGLPACSLESRDAATDYKASTQPAKMMRLSHHVADSSLPSPIKNDGLPAFLDIDGYVIDRIVLLCDISQTPPLDDVTHFPIRDAHAAVRAHNPTRDTYGSTLQHIDEAFWRTLIANRSSHCRPAADDHLQVWTLYFRAYEAARSGQGKAEVLPDVPQDDETWELRRRNGALWFLQADDEDLRFTHMLATDLARRWPEHRHALGAASVLNRPFDFTQATEPRMSAGRQFCVTEKGHFGLVPWLTAVGDIVALFDGAKNPHVVRPLEVWDTRRAVEEKVRCRLVGDCFIHEGMDGQLERDLGLDAPKGTFVLE